MKFLQRLFLSLAFSLPVGSISGGLLLLLIEEYDYVYSINLGPILAIMMLILIPYSLLLPVLNYRTIRQHGWRKAWQDHVQLPFTRILPLIFLLGITLWAWLFAVMRSFTHFISDELPEGIVMLLAFLLYVGEAFKTRSRLDRVSAYYHEQTDATPPLKWSRTWLRMFACTQPVFFLLGIGISTLLVLQLSRLVLEPWASLYMQQLINLLLFAACIYGMRIFEQRAEAYGQSAGYLP